MEYRRQQKRFLSWLPDHVLEQKTFFLLFLLPSVKAILVLFDG